MASSQSPDKNTVDTFMARQRLNRRLRPVLAWGLRLLIKILARMTIHNVDRVPDSGATILMINHISGLDPAIITGMIRKRHAITMVKAETMTSYPWMIRTLLKLWGHLPVERDKLDTAALKKSLALLDNGEMLLLAPEGTRRPDGLNDARAGIAYLATKADCVIVPVAIVGELDWRERWFKHHRRLQGDIYVGQPFRFTSDTRPNKTMREQMMREAMYQLALLIPDEYAPLRGKFGDFDNATTDMIEFV